MKGPAPPVLAGIAMMVAAMQVVPVNDAIAKVLSATLPVLVVVFARTFMQSCFLLLFMAVRQRRPQWRLLVSRAQVLRGLLWWAATALFFVAIRDNDIPTALALFFAGPLFVAVSAPMLLGEPFSPRLLVAAAAGFAGALVILLPTAGSVLDSTLALALLAGIGYSSYLMATRHVAATGKQSATEVALAGGLWATLFGLPAMLWAWDGIDSFEMLLAVAMGFMSALGHVLIALASQRASASQLAPYCYTEIIGALIASLAIFGTLPPAGAWLGIGLITAGGVWAALDARAKPSPAELDPPV